MFIVPYIYKRGKTSDNLVIHRIEILCEGGKTLWIEEDSTPIKDIFEPNGLYTQKVKKLGKHILAKIDTNKTDLSSMYTYPEIGAQDNETLCWKSMIMISNHDSSEWLPFPVDDLQDILRVILKTERV